MSTIIESDCLECQICLEEFYSNENLIPNCLECGHTFCKRCINKMAEEKRLKCPIDKRDIVLSSDTIYGTENFIIKKTIALMNCLEINVKPFCKLSLSYCSTCNLFISNFVKDIHTSVYHKVISIAAYTFKWFDYISNNISLKKITPTIMMYLIAYLFQSPYIFQSKQFSVKEILSLNNKMFTFYGEHYSRTEKNKRFYKIVKCILSDNNVDYANYIIKKGIVIGCNLQIMHGYFLIGGAKPYRVIKGIGVLNYIDVSYFGIFSFMPQPQHSGFAFDYGILKQSGTFFMGTFNHNNYEFPIYNFVSGEEIINAIQRTYVIRKPYLNDLTEETVEPFDEITENNMYYKCIKNSIHFKSTITKIPKCEVRYTFNDQKGFENCLGEVAIIYEQGEAELDKGKQEMEKKKETPFDNNNCLSKIVIKPINTSPSFDYLHYKISDCNILLTYKTIDIVISFAKDDNNDNAPNNHIIISNAIPSSSLSSSTNKKSNYLGYDIVLTQNEDTNYLNDLANFKLEGVLKDNPILLNFLQCLFNTKLTNCKILYQLFKGDSKQKLHGSLFYSFNIPEGTITGNHNSFFKRNEVIHCDNLKEMTIKNLIPNIYCSESFDNIAPKFEIINHNNNNNDVDNNHDDSFAKKKKKNCLKECTIKCNGCLII